MTSRTPRRTALGALALTVALATSACGTTDPGAAVLLGAQSVPVELLERQVSARLAAAGAGAALDTRDELQRQVLTQLVRSRLLDRIAQEEGVTVPGGEVEATLQRLAGGVPTVEEAYRVAAEQAGLDREAAFSLARDDALRTALVPALAPQAEVDEAQLRAAYEESLAEFDTVSVRVLPVSDPVVAEQTLADLRADPSRFEELAAERGVQGAAEQTAPVEVGRGTSSPELDAQLFSTPVGGSFVFTQGGTSFVVVVTDRTTVPFEQAREQLRQRVLEPQGERALVERLAQEAEELGVTVNPRFGEWDAQALEVVTPDPETSRPAGGAQTEVPTLPGEAGDTVEPGADPETPGESAP